MDKPKQLLSATTRLLVYRSCFPFVAVAARALEIRVVICSTVRFGNDVIGTCGRCWSAVALHTHHCNHAVGVTPNNHFAVEFPLPAVSA
jgi:hypothetical protein